MTLQALNLIAHSLNILPRTLQVLTILRTAHALSQFTQLPLFIFQQLKRLLLDENPIRTAIVAGPITPIFRSLSSGIKLRLDLR
jgi:hypothetical protein